MKTSGATSRVTSRAMCRGTRTRSVAEVVDDGPARGGVVNDERHDEPWDEPRDAEWSTTSGATSRATCRSNRKRGVGKLIPL
jgi:hypothetical protein